MRARLTLGFVLAGALVALSAQVAPQAPPAAPATTQIPPFRVEANYVRVDMYATSRGQPVEDLVAADIELLEDGAPQTVTAFEHVVVRPPVAQDARIEPNTVAESRQLAADPRARVFVIFLDTHHTQIEGSATMRGPLVRFLDRLLGPDDLVALMTPEMAAGDIALARKTAAMSNIMQREWTWGRRGRLSRSDDPRERLYDTCYPDIGESAGIATQMKNRRRETLTFDALDDLVQHLQGLREERKAIITVTEGWLLQGPDRTLARATQGNRGPTLPDPFGRGQRNAPDRRASDVVSTTQCEADRNALAFADNRNRVRELSERANRANVTFYPVSARGLALDDAPMGPDRPPTPAEDRANLANRQDAMRQLAIEADGLEVIGSNDIDRGMQRILSDLSSYYLLSYYSTNTRLDGRFRNITVRVRRPGVQVRARRGYRAATADDLTRGSAGGGGAAAAPAGVAAAFNAVAGVSTRSQFRLRAATWPRVGGAGVAGTVWVTGELDYALRRDVAWTAGATADVVVVAATGAQVLSTTVAVDAATGLLTLTLPQAGGLPPGEYALRIRVRPNQDGTIPVSDTARIIVPSAAARLGEAVIWRRGPTTGPRFMMTADPRFTRNDRLRLEHATTGAGAASARLVDRQGKTLAVPVSIAERPGESGDFRWMTVDLALAPLAPGSYAIEVSLDDAKSVTAFTVIP